MALSDVSAQTVRDELPQDLAEAGVYSTTKAGFDHGLVVLALGLPFWLLPAGEKFRLMVEAPVVNHVREQLAQFDRESAGWPPRPVVEKWAMRRAELFTPLLWVGTVLGSFWMQGKSLRWTQAGALDAQAVFERGEWWRPFTALFLHADVGHLVSNVVSGLFVFSAVLTTMGRKRGWLGLALASVGGNLAAAALNASMAYRSIGASTAIFAGLGLLTGRAVRRALRAGHPHRWRTMGAPLAAGLAVLGLFGAGDVRVDVLAHLTGFVAGLVLGFAAEKTSPVQTDAA